MGNINDEVFVCLDCETTGLDANLDRVIEVAVVRFTLGGLLAEFQSLIDPQCHIPESSIVFHHITPEMVQGKTHDR